MPWSSEYPPMSEEREAEIRAHIEASIDAEIVACEAEMLVRSRWSRVSWIEKIKDKKWINGQWKSENPSKKTPNLGLSP